MLNEPTCPIVELTRNFCYTSSIMGMEGNPEGHNFGRRWADIEGRKLEIGRLKATIGNILAVPVGDPTSPKVDELRFRQLEAILAAEPQRDLEGRLRYLVTSGFAVEMITGFKREHHDLDFVIMDAEQTDHWSLMGTDNVTPGEYWAGMHFDPDFLEGTARSVRTRKLSQSPSVEVVHPAIIMVQKSSDAFGRPPRPKDTADVTALIHYWKETEQDPHEWDPIISISLDALPPGEMHVTLKRMRSHVSEK